VAETELSNAASLIRSIGEIKANINQEGSIGKTLPHVPGPVSIREIRGELLFHAK
jgi:hypothetical protein